MASNSGYSVELADVDGNGSLDAILGGANGLAELWLNQAGIFTQESSFPTQGFQAIDIGAADVDNDGDVDVVFGYGTGFGNEVYLNQGGVQGGTQGVFALGDTFGPPSYVTALELGDVDGDGDVDAFVGRSRGGAYASQAYPSVVFLNDGNGNFVDSGQSLVANPNDPSSQIFKTRDLKLGDVDNDGDLDAFLANSISNVVYLNNGSGIFSDSGQLLGSNTDNYSVALGDVDGDGNLDAFVGVNGPNKVWINDAEIFGTIINDDFNTPPVFTEGAEQTFTIPENSPGGTPVGSSAATDADSDTLVYSITAASNPGGDGFAIDSNGQITIDNAASLDLDFDDGSPNVAMLTVNVNDGTEDVQQSVTIDVAPVNDAPVVVNPIADVSANEDDPDDTINVSNVFDDVDAGDSLTLTVSGNTNPGLLSASIVGGNLLLGYLVDQSGTVDITVRATDVGGLFAEDTLTVTVLSAQDQVDNLINDVDGLVPEFLTAKDAGKLTAKLQDATDKLNNGKLKAGVNKIGSFINQVNAFVNSGKLTEAQAASLIAAANAAIASAGGGGGALVTVATSAASSAASTQPVSHVDELVVDTLTISLNDSSSGTSAEQHDALQSAIGSLNASLGAYGVALVEVASAADAVVRIEIVADSVCGSAADGVLGCAAAGEITLLSGWNWYLDADANAIAASQYDFQTILTHELGHSIGLDHSGDADSVMYDTLSTSIAHRELTEQDLSLISNHTEDEPVALRAAGWSASDTGSLATFASLDTVSNRAGLGVGFDRGMSYDTLSPTLSQTLDGLPMKRRDRLVASRPPLAQPIVSEMGDAKRLNVTHKRPLEDELSDKADWSAAVDQAIAELEETTEA